MFAWSHSPNSIDVTEKCTNIINFSRAEKPREWPLTHQNLENVLEKASGNISEELRIP